VNLSKEAAASIIEGHTENFRESLFCLSSGKIATEAARLYVQSRKFFFSESSGFTDLADMLQLSVEAVRHQLRHEETVCLTEAGLDDVNFAKLVAKWTD
jgi:hypothetical protein